MAYTQIVGIIAPSSATYGQTVNVEVKVKNIYSVPFFITVTGAVNGGKLYFGNETKYIAAGETKSFYDSFTMPGKNIRLWVWSWWFLSPDWIEDDNAYKDISFSAEVAVSGRFTKPDGGVQIYDPNTGAWSTARPTVYPGQTIKMRVEVENTSSVYANMKIESEFHTKYGYESNNPVVAYSVAPGSKKTLEIEHIIPEIGSCTAENACHLYVSQVDSPWPSTPSDEKSYSWCTVAVREPIFSGLEINFTKTAKV